MAYKDLKFKLPTDAETVEITIHGRVSADDELPPGTTSVSATIVVDVSGYPILPDEGEEEEPEAPAEPEAEEAPVVEEPPAPEGAGEEPPPPPGDEPEPEIELGPATEIAPEPVAGSGAEEVAPE